MTRKVAKSLKAVIVGESTAKVPLVNLLYIHAYGELPAHPWHLYNLDMYETSTDINGKKYALCCHHPTGYLKCSDVLRSSSKTTVG